MNYYFLVLQRYAQFSGRARRSEYWYFVLFSSIISIILLLVSLSMNIPHLGNIYSLVVAIPTLAVGVRRMHDVDKSGWFILIPFYNLILFCTDSTPGDNEYGENPKGSQSFSDSDYERPLDVD